MTGLLITEKKIYIFRTDTLDDKIWAWDIHNDKQHEQCYKWDKMPKGEIITFDIDNPPQTVPFLPTLI